MSITDSSMLPSVTGENAHHLPGRPRIVSTLAFDPADGEATLQDAVRILLKHKLTILFSTLLMTGLAVLYCLVTPNLYTAIATLEIKGYAPILSGTTSESLYGLDTRKAEYQKTTIAKLKQQVVADRVLSLPGIADTLRDYFSDGTPADENRKAKEEKKIDPTFNHSPNFIEAYLGLIDINPVYETSLVDIEVTTRRKDLSQQIANAHAQGFIDVLRTERQESMMVNLKSLQEQAANLSADLSEAEKDLAKYAEKNRLIATTGGENGELIIMKNIASLSQSLAEAVAKRIKSESILSELQSAGPQDSTTLDDEGIRSLRLELDQTQAGIRSLGARVTSEYPAMKELISKAASLKQSIANHRQQLFRGLSIQVESDKTLEKNLAKKLEQERDNAFEASTKLVQYNVLNKKANSLQQLYETVLKQLQETQFSAVAGVSNITISNRASMPVRPSAPKTNLLVVIGAFIGFVIGIVIAAAREALDNRLKTPDQVATVSGLPVLGTIPSFLRKSTDESKSKKRPNVLLEGGSRPTATDGEISTDAPVVTAKNNTHTLITITAPHTNVAEALRTIRTSLLLSSADGPTKILMITSPEQGDGKTTISANLAVSLAQADYRTLLIDADLRQPVIGSLFSEAVGQTGLAEVLANQAKLSEVLWQSQIPNLSVISAGARPPNPAELTGSRKMQVMIEALRPEYDFIIIDAPPVLAVSDSLAMSQFMDGVIIVGQSKKTLKATLKEATKRLRIVNAKLIGVILNAFDDPSFSRGSDKYYNYYETRSAAANE